MTDQDRRDIEADCRSLFIAYSHALDDADPQRVASLYAPDGVWARPGEDIRGRAAIAAAIGARDRRAVTRHLLSNIDIRVIDADHAEGRAYYIVYRDDGAARVDFPRPVPASPMRIGDYLATFIRTAEGWRLARASPRRVFDLGA